MHRQDLGASSRPEFAGQVYGHKDLGSAGGEVDVTRADNNGGGTASAAATVVKEELGDPPVTAAAGVEPPDGVVYDYGFDSTIVKKAWRKVIGKPRSAPEFAEAMYTINKDPKEYDMMFAVWRDGDEQAVPG